MPALEPVEYRNKSGPPRKPGWYYGRMTGFTKIEPVLVFTKDTRLTTGMVGAEHPLGRYDWFGPVTEVREG